MNYIEDAYKLLNNIETKTKDEIIDSLIQLGERNIFIPVMIEFVKLAKAEGKYPQIRIMEDYINEAYSPGLRAHILDDFVRERLKIQSEINELKTKHNIYVLEQKLFMYKQAEQMLRSNATSGSTYEIMKILEFRGDFYKKNM